MQLQIKFVSFLLLILFAIQKGKAQSNPAISDLQLIRSTSFSTYDTVKYYRGEMNNQKIMNTPFKGAVARANPLLLVAKGGMWVYQNTLSPQLSRECPYEITCSNFSKRAIQELGLFKGVLVSADRLMRCNPFSLSRVDENKIDKNTQKIIDYPWWYK